MTLRAADVAELLIRTAEEGGSAAAVVVVGGADGLLGRRLALVQSARDRPRFLHSLPSIASRLAGAHLPRRSDPRVEPRVATPYHP